MSSPNFDKPTNEWINEPVEVSTFEPTFDKKGQLVGLKKGTRIVNQRTMYSETSERVIDCGHNKHYWTIPNRNDHIAKCSNCTKRHMIRAVYEMVKDGKILHRDTHEQID